MNHQKHKVWDITRFEDEFYLELKNGYYIVLSTGKVKEPTNDDVPVEIVGNITEGIQEFLKYLEAGYVKR